MVAVQGHGELQEHQCRYMAKQGYTDLSADSVVLRSDITNACSKLRVNFTIYMNIYNNMNEVQLLYGSVMSC